MTKNLEYLKKGPKDVLFKPIVIHSVRPNLMDISSPNLNIPPFSLSKLSGLCKIYQFVKKWRFGLTGCLGRQRDLLLEGRKKQANPNFGITNNNGTITITISKGF